MIRHRFTYLALRKELKIFKKSGWVEEHRSFHVEWRLSKWETGQTLNLAESHWLINRRNAKTLGELYPRDLMDATIQVKGFVQMKKSLSPWLPSLSSSFICFVSWWMDGSDDKIHHFTAKVMIILQIFRTERGICTSFQDHRMVRVTNEMRRNFLQQRVSKISEETN